jgi:hypothetical protein
MGTTYTWGCEFLDDGSLAVPFRPDDPPDHGRFEGQVVTRVPRAETWVGDSAFDERDVANELRRDGNHSRSGPATHASRNCPSRTDRSI